MHPALPQPDFLRPVQRPGALAWAWCATGVLVLAATALDSQAAWRSLQGSRQALAPRPAGAAALAATPGPANPPPTRAPTSATAAAAAERARAAEARHWRAQLAWPWQTAWAAADAAPAGLRWLGLEHSNGGALRLTALAADLATAEAALQALHDQQDGGEPRWQSVLLAASQRSADGQRVEILARPAPVDDDANQTAPADAGHAPSPATAAKARTAASAGGRP